MKELIRKAVRERAKFCCEYCLAPLLFSSDFFSFEWHENFTIIIGISPTGRATEKRLALNRVGVVNLRGILVEKGFHPPYEK